MKMAPQEAAKTGSGGGRNDTLHVKTCLVRPRNGSLCVRNGLVRGRNELLCRRNDTLCVRNEPLYVRNGPVRLRNDILLARNEAVENFAFFASLRLCVK